MKVQFSPDEAHAMLQAVLEDVTALKLDAKDKAVVRRWLDEMKPTSLAVQALAEKISDEIQQTHDRSEVSSIKKPDWL